MQSQIVSVQKWPFPAISVSTIQIDCAACRGMLPLDPFLGDERVCVDFSVESFYSEKYFTLYYTQIERFSSLPQVQGKCRSAIVNYAGRHLTP